MREKRERETYIVDARLEVVVDGGERFDRVLEEGVAVREHVHNAENQRGDGVRTELIYRD